MNDRSGRVFRVVLEQQRHHRGCMRVMRKRRIIIVVVHDHRHAHRGCSVGDIVP
jgi:hypothetical protein